MALTRCLLMLAAAMWLATNALPAQDDLSSPHTPESQARARQLVRQMIAAAGGMERWNSVRDVTYVLRSVLLDGRRAPFVTIQRVLIRRDPRPMVRTDIPVGRSLHTQVFDGTETWLAVDGILLQKDPATYERIRASAKRAYYWFSFPFLLVDPSVEADHLGTARLQGGEMQILQVSFRDDSVALNASDVHRYYVSSATHLVAKEEYYPGGLTDGRLDILWGDYRLVGDLVKDHVREFVSAAPGYPSQRLEVAEIEFSAGAAPERFRKPRDPMALEKPAE